MITRFGCSPQGAHNDFIVVVPGRNTGLVMIVTGSESSGLCACPVSHAILNYQKVMIKRLASATVYERSDDPTAISACQSRARARRGPE